MSQEFEVSVEELLRTLKRRGVPLPSEMGAFITLEICEQILDRPVLVTTREVAISEIGEVLCAIELAAVPEAESVRALLLLLGDLLVCSAPGVPSMLLELVEHGPSGGELTLERLRDDLEASLLPLNRGATRRVLARLLREARKSVPSLRAKATPTADELDAQFDAIMEAAAPAAAGPPPGGGQAPAARGPRGVFRSDVPPSGAGGDAVELAAPRPRPVTPGAKPEAVSRRERRATPAGAVEEAEPGRARRAPPTGHAQLDPGAAVDGDAASRADRSAPRAGFRPGPGGAEPAAARSLPQQPRAQRASAPLDTEGLLEVGERRTRVGAWIFVTCTVAAIALVAGYAALGRQGARRALGLTEPVPSAPPAAAASRPTAAARGDLEVNSTPPRAQVLLFIGRGPALATDVPLGVAQEFVAVADGHKPARAVVPADAVWDQVDGKPRYELAIQTSPAKGRGDPSLDLGATLLPRDVGTPQARSGSVRVVTTPKGAKVYQLVGFTPDARVEQLPLDQSYEVLVYLQGYTPVVKQLTSADFVEGESARTASLEVALERSK